MALDSHKLDYFFTWFIIVFAVLAVDDGSSRMCGKIALEKVHLYDWTMDFFSVGLSSADYHQEEWGSRVVLCIFIYPVFKTNHLPHKGTLH